MKYYVQSGGFKVVISGTHIKNAISAACEAFLSNYKKDIDISAITVVSEQGFNIEDPDHRVECDIVLDTCEILIEAGFGFNDDRC